MQSKYSYKGSDVLINFADITDQAQLDEFETYVAHKKLTELGLQPLKGKFNLKHMVDIHKTIFGDIYPFAGKIREENIAKDSFMFAQATFIESAATYLFGELAAENYLANLNIDAFSDRLAHYMAEINVLHPFREGNGRTTREFIRLLALNAGYEIDWGRVDKDRLFRASVKSVRDITDLAKVLRETIVNDFPEPKLVGSVLKRR